MRRGLIFRSVSFRNPSLFRRMYCRILRANTARAGPCSVKLVSKCAKELGMEVVRYV